MISKKNYNSIDFIKFIMAICVISIHTHPFETCKNSLILSINDAIVNLAVPFFFIASGFLLAKKYDKDLSSHNNANITKKSLVKILKMYLIWTAIYLPMTIYNYIDLKYSAIKSIADFVRGLVIVGQHYNSWHLWYLLSTVYSLIVVLIVIRAKLSEKALGVIAGAFLIISVAFNFIGTYDGGNSVLAIANKIVHYSLGNGRIFLGAFYIPVGIILSRVRLNKILSVALVLVGFVASVFNNVEILNPILTALVAIGLFEIVLLINLKPSPIYPFMRNMSTVMYLIHLYVWTGYYMIIYGEKVQGFDSFIVTTIVSALISAIYVAIKQRNAKLKSNINTLK